MLEIARLKPAPKTIWVSFSVSACAILIFFSRFQRDEFGGAAWIRTIKAHIPLKNHAK
jgi:hypothetical protein